MAVTSSTPAGVAAVVTVSYGSEDVLSDFLSSIPRASASHLTSVVVDNLPSSGSTRALAADAGAHYIAMPENPGYGGALNAAVAALPNEVEWVLLSNPDVVLGASCIDILMSVGAQDPSIASVGPLVLTAEGEVYPSARAVPSLRTGVGHALFANLWTNNPWTRSYRRETEGTPTRRDAGWLSGSCLLVRRSAFESIGGFDTGYFMYFEDVDLGYRFGRAGYRNLYEPAANVTHTGAHSTRGDASRMIAAHHASARRFLTRKYSGWALWPVRVVLTVGLTVRSAVFTRRAGHH